MKKKRNKEFAEVKQILSEKGLIVAEEKDYEQFLDIVLSAFEKDELMNWLAQGKNVREYVRNIFNIVIHLSDEKLIYFDSEERQAVAFWMTSEIKLYRIKTLINSGAKELVKLGGIPFLKRVLSYEHSAGKLKRKYSGKNSWYLYIFAAGEGNNQRLIYADPVVKPVTEYCWEKGIPCYAEVNSVLDTVAMKQAGFQVREVNTVPKSTVKQFSLLL